MNIWDKYERSKDYIDKQSIISKTNQNWDFYLGNQWKGIKVGVERPPMYNFIKKNIKYKIGTVCQNRQSAHYATGKNSNEDKQICSLLDTEYANNWAKSKMDTKIWNVAKAAAVAADSYIFWGSKSFKECQILPNTCVLLSDETNENIQEQKYVIIRERLFVRDVKKMALNNGIEQSQVDAICSDDETNYMIGNDQDIDVSGDDGKVTSIIYMEKRDGCVWLARAVKNLEYLPLAPLAPTDMLTGETMTDQGMHLYPIASLVWESIPNSARGQGAVAEMIPNQIETNKTLFRRIISSKLSSYPRLAVNVDSITNKDDLDKVGATIGVRGGSSQRVTDMVSYLPPQAMSQDAKTINDDLIDMTTSLSGSDDAITGTSDLARVASSTVLAVKDQQALSLNENVAKIKQLYEDIAKIWFDQLRVYNRDGVEINGQLIGADVLDQLEPDIQITVTQDTVWTRDNEQTWWDNALQNQYITFDEYCKFIPNGGTVPKDKLKELMQERVDKEIEQAQQQIQSIQNGEMDDQIASGQPQGGQGNAVQ